MSIILGINAFHADSAACIVQDGELVSAVAEERLGHREKHCPSFPGNAIRCVLRQAALKLKDVTHVALARDPKANLMAKARYVASRPVQATGAVWQHFNRNNVTTDAVGQLAEVCGEPRSHAQFKLVPVEHHLAHVASAYYASPFDATTAALTYDASGDFVSTMVARCEGNKIQVLDRVTLPHSLGFFYTAICQFIGFNGFGEEYKVMGLAPYGHDVHRELMQKLLVLIRDGWFRLSPGWFGMHKGGENWAVDDRGHVMMARFFSDRFRTALGEPRSRNGSLTQREKDLARSCQVRFEEAAVHCANRLASLVPSHQLVMAGGCSLNGVANARILRETAFKDTYLQPAASDDGTSLGAALWCYHNVAGGSERFHMDHAFWGPGYDAEEIATAVESVQCPVRVLDDATLIDEVVRLLRAGCIVGWFQGRSEWGPRALGNRSILADPTNPDMKDIINAKIKRRESFRPFAPSVLAESAARYFEQPVSSPFMMHVVKFKPEWRDKLPAVVHVDGTGRIQTVSRDTNPRYYDLIKRFGQVSGVDIVLNTSFNENEPIVDTPEQAVACFRRTDMDALVLGNHVLYKSDQVRKSKGVVAAASIRG